jgi:hypothetical protein
MDPEECAIGAILKAIANYVVIAHRKKDSCNSSSHRLGSTSISRNTISTANPVGNPRVATKARCEKRGINRSVELMLTICPYLLKPIAELDEVSDEHIIPHAMGGSDQFTLPAEKRQTPTSARQ